jgi:hypothetical protein
VIFSGLFPRLFVRPVRTPVGIGASQINALSPAEAIDVRCVNLSSAGSTR